MKPFLLLCVVLYVIIIPYSFAFLKLGLLSKFCFWSKGGRFLDGWIPRALPHTPACSLLRPHAAKSDKKKKGGLPFLFEKFYCSSEALTLAPTACTACWARMVVGSTVSWCRFTCSKAIGSSVQPKIIFWAPSARASSTSFCT